MSSGTNKDRLQYNNSVLNEHNTFIESITNKTSELVSTMEITATPNDVRKSKMYIDRSGKLVEGTMEAGSSDIPVKLFDSVEDMNADTDAKENDLAIVYREEIQNATADSKFQTAKFPMTVVLPEAVTDYIDVRYRAVDTSVMFDCWGSLNSSRFYMDCYTDNGSIRIEYESSDGITYTRTDGGEELIDFGTEIYYEMPEYWNDAIGYFIQAGGNTFEGLFQFKTNYTEQNIYKNANYLDDQPNYYNIDERLLALRKYGRTFIIPNVVENRGEYLDIVSGTLYTSTSSEYKIVKQPSRTLLCLGAWDSDTDSTVIFTKIDFDLSLDNIIVSKTSILKADLNNYPYKFSINNYMCTWYSDMILTDQIIVNIDLDVLKVITTVDDAQPSSAISGEIVYYRVENLIHNSYKYAPTQLTLSDSNQLLPGKIGYGKNGVVESDGTIWDNIPRTTIYDMLGLKPLINNGTSYTHLQIYGDSTAAISNLPTGKIYTLKRDNDGDIIIGTTEEIVLTEHGKYGNHKYDEEHQLELVFGRYDKKFTIYDINGNTLHEQVFDDYKSNSYIRIMTYGDYGYLIYHTSNTAYKVCKVHLDTFEWTDVITPTDYFTSMHVSDRYVIFVPIAASTTLMVLDIYTGEVHTGTIPNVSAGYSFAVQVTDTSFLMPCSISGVTGSIIIKYDNGTITTTHTSDVKIDTSFGETGQLSVNTMEDGKYMAVYGTTAWIFTENSINKYTLSSDDDCVNFRNNYNNQIIGLKQAGTHYMYSGTRVYDLKDITISGDTISITNGTIVNTGTTLNNVLYGISDTYIGINLASQYFYLDNGVVYFDNFSKNICGLPDSNNIGLVKYRINNYSMVDEYTDDCITCINAMSEDSNMSHTILFGKVTPDDYDIAVETANEILGEEV